MDSKKEKLKMLMLSTRIVAMAALTEKLVIILSVKLYLVSKK